MMGDLRSKLAMYKASSAEQPKQPGKGHELEIHNIMTGHECSNDDGSCFIIENRFPLTYLHGGCQLGDVLKTKIELLKSICPDLDEAIELHSLAFLDTETTGLSGGTGTVAFLIGIGVFEEQSFVLRQYFMRDYNEEPAMLREINNLLLSYKGLVTFNGKAFDWNLLETRFTFNRIRPSLKKPVHIDLLYPSRRIWKLKLESCRLSCIEENILGEYRVDDIPGALIPGIYFKYLDDRDASALRKVIKHNEIDIITMVSLLVKIHAMLDNPMAETDGSHELLGVGGIFEAGREYKMVVDCFETCMKSSSRPVKEAAARKLSGIYKKSRNYEKAVEHWRSMLTGTDSSDIFPLIELAKYYEHREKDFSLAIEMVESAMRLSHKMGCKNNIHYDELKKRMDRLKRKAGRK